jgi:hypothetical protein
LDKSKYLSLGPKVLFGSAPERKLVLALNRVRFWSSSSSPERLPSSLLFCRKTSSSEDNLLIAVGIDFENLFPLKTKETKRCQLPNHPPIGPTSILLPAIKFLTLVNARQMDDGMLPLKRLFAIPKFSSRISEEIVAGSVPRSLFLWRNRLVRLVKELPTKAGMELES